ncbi:hypothetical protein ACFLZV_01630 [Candidatus Margulisiibacteriota bacterium]
MYKIVSCFKEIDLPFDKQKEFIIEPNKYFEVLKPELIEWISMITSGKAEKEGYKKIEELQNLEETIVDRRVLKGNKVVRLLKRNSKEEGSLKYIYRNAKQGWNFYSIEIIGLWENGRLVGEAQLKYEDCKNGITYTGAFNDNKLQGVGKYTKSTNDSNGVIETEVSYSGKWRANYPDGQGSFVFEDGITLFTDWCKGFPIGNVKYTQKSGTKFADGRIDYNQNAVINFTGKIVGVFTGKVAKNGALNGIGEIAYPNGDKYEGNISNGMRSIGKMFYYKNGKLKECYIGDWNNDKKDTTIKDSRSRNFGVSVSERNGKLYFHCGNWKNDMKEGNGNEFVITKPMKLDENLDYVMELSEALFFPNGNWMHRQPKILRELESKKQQIFVGKYENGKKSTGEYFYADGTKITVTEHDNGDPSNGNIYYINKDKYTGRITKEFQKEGMGQYTFLDGTKVSGNWKDDKLIEITEIQFKKGDSFSYNTEKTKKSKNEFIYGTYNNHRSNFSLEGYWDGNKVLGAEDCKLTFQGNNDVCLQIYQGKLTSSLERTGFGSYIFNQFVSGLRLEIIGNWANNIIEEKDSKYKELEISSTSSGELSYTLKEEGDYSKLVGFRRDDQKKNGIDFYLTGKEEESRYFKGKYSFAGQFYSFKEQPVFQEIPKLDELNKKFSKIGGLNYSDKPLG